MRAMLFLGAGQPLQPADIPIPKADAGQVLVKINACAVCRTDLHIIDGDLPDPKVPLVPGHEIVGRVVQMGTGVGQFKEGDRVGIPWLGWTCGHCEFCSSGRENLCKKALFTGYTLDGGYAEYTVADARYCFRIPDAYSDAEAAPLLCAGMIGYRSLVKAGSGKCLGIYGFGAAAHIVAQVAIHQGRKVFAFTRPGDAGAQEFARSLGAAWSGDSTQSPPEALDAALIFAPVGGLVPSALKTVDRGGVVVCGGIHMSDIPAFPYQLLWQERSLCSVANLTRHDGTDFLQLAPQVPVRVAIQTYPLSEANLALKDLREGKLEGAAVLLMN